MAWQEPPTRRPPPRVRGADPGFSNGWLLRAWRVSPRHQSAPQADGDVVAACLENKSSGVVRLDPAVSGAGKILKRWGLRMNVTLLAEDAS
jgi:hypothetical protein